MRAPTFSPVWCGRRFPSVVAVFDGSLNFRRFASAGVKFEHSAPNFLKHIAPFLALKVPVPMRGGSVKAHKNTYPEMDRKKRVLPRRQGMTDTAEYAPTVLCCHRPFPHDLQM